jgi:hypothetical protein
MGSSSCLRLSGMIEIISQSAWRPPRLILLHGTRPQQIHRVINTDEIACDSGRIREVIRCGERGEKYWRAAGEEADEDRDCVGGDAGGCASERAEIVCG